MNITARRISGSTFSAEDKLEVTLNSDGSVINSVTHTLEQVSGVVVNHGGGCGCGTYLNYNTADTEVGLTIDMAVVQEGKGSSVVKAVANIVTQDAQDSFISDADAYKSAADAAGVTPDLPNGTDGSFAQTPPEPPSPVILKTGNITLEWLEDSFV